MAPLEPRLPAGAIQRLVEHYPAGAPAWLGGAEATLVRVARQHGVRLVGYHDAGWTSVIAVGVDPADRPVILKALPEPDRFQRELAALQHWDGQGVCRLVAADTTAHVLLLEQIGGRAGGVARPSNHPERVAEALACLHKRPAPAHPAVPRLADYYRGTVVPRMERRAAQFGHVVGPRRITAAVRLSRILCVNQQERALLHADLYAENVLFGEEGEVVFIDPHAVTGSPAFDWAFWIVYYQPDSGFEERVALCARHTPADMTEVLAWVATLAVDGALYYLATKDPRLDALLAVLASPTVAPLVVGR